MPEELDTMLSRTVNPFTPLTVGDMVVGWVAPHTKGNADGYTYWYVAVGDSVFGLSYSWFMACCDRWGLKMPREMRRATYFEADFVIKLPAKSIELSNTQRVNYTERTTQYLQAAFIDYVRVFKNAIQSQLNNKDFDEAVTMYRNLKAYHYTYSSELMWRGQPAEKVLGQPILESVAEVMTRSDK